MSIVLYLVSDFSFEEQVEDTISYSISELEKKGITKKDLKKQFANWAIDLSQIERHEKLFFLIDDLFDEGQPAFSVLEDADPQVIVKYTKKRYYYEIRINNKERFYSEFIEYLEDQNKSFELWKIWEGEYEPYHLRTHTVKNWTHDELEKIFGDRLFRQSIKMIKHA